MQNSKTVWRLRNSIFLVLTLLGAFSLLGCLGEAKSKSALNTHHQKHLNVLFIPVDDLKPRLGCYGDTTIHTPNIDRLANNGMVFLNNSCQQAICGPSRASLLTGLYPDDTRVWDLKTKMRKVNPDILTIPQYFKQNGYVTAGIGKTFDPRCVDDLLDSLSWSIPYVKVNSVQYANPDVIAAYKKAEKLVRGRNFEVDYERQEAKVKLGGPLCRPSTECMDVPDETYADGAIAKAALELLDELESFDKPFFLSVGFLKPHLPFVAPKKYWDLYDPEQIFLEKWQKKALNGPDIAYKGLWELKQYSDIEGKLPLDTATQRRLIHGYKAAISYVDAQIGLLLDKLEELGLDQNTVICLWGDHGFHLGDHGMWTKHTNFEQAVRAPLIISSPSFKAGKTDAPTEFVDLFPTLCELVGLDVPFHLPGESLVPLMKDPSPSVRFAALAQYPRYKKDLGPVMGYTLRSKRYRYVKWLAINYRNGERTGQLVATELYDYLKDPLETVNLAEDPKYKDVVELFENEFKRRNVAMTN